MRHSYATILLMADNTPIRKTGLSPKEQKLQALREKLANASAGTRPTANTAATGFQGKSALGAKKTAFQRKAT
jgi:hypothetical protein